MSTIDSRRRTRFPNRAYSRPGTLATLWLLFATLFAIVWVMRRWVLPAPTSAG